MRRPLSTVLVLSVLAMLMSTLPAVAIDARTSIPGGMCSPWTTKQASSAMKEQMKVVREDPDNCVWYSKKDHNGNISTLSVNLWRGDQYSDVPLIDQARGESWRNWTREDTVAGVPMLLTDVRRSGKNRDITAAAFPDDITWLDVNATSVIGADVRRAVKHMVEVAAPAFAIDTPSPSPAASRSAAGSGIADACTLLTTDEVSAALGETMSPSDGAPEQCIYSGTSGTFLQVEILTPEPGDTTPMMERRLERSPESTPIEVAGYPALFEIGPLLGVPSVYVYPDPAVELELELVTGSDLDAQTVLTGLAELAVPRMVAAGLPVPPTPIPAPSLAAAGGVCDLLTAEEVSAALGESVTASELSSEACQYIGDVAGGSLTGMAVILAEGDRAAELLAQVGAQETTPITVGGHPATQAATQELATGYSRSMVAVTPNETTALVLSADAPAGIDVAAAVLGLAEAAVARLG